MNCRLLVISSVFVLVAYSSSSYAQNPARESLRALPGVRVVVEDIEEQAEGLSVQEIKTDIELRLRKAGIRILDKADGYLYANINLIRSKTSLMYAVSVSIELKQPVTIVRNSVLVPSAATWYTGGVVIVGSEKLSALRELIGHYVDEFINDYLAVNPK